MRRLFAAAAAVGSVALVAGTLSAPATGAAPTSAKAVSLAPLPAKSEVGKRITVKGTVAGGRATVRIQRKYAGGGWQNVARTTSTRAGGYAVKVKLVRGGTTSFRAVKGAARSGTRSLKVYQWLDVALQPHLLLDQVISNQPVRIGGRRFARSFQRPGFGAVLATVDRLCTRGEAWTGFRDEDVAAVPDGVRAGVLGVGLRANGTPVESSPQPTLVSTGRARLERFPLTGAADVIFQFGFQGDPPSEVYAVLATPRVYCNAPALPAVDGNPIQNVKQQQRRLGRGWVR